MKTVTAQPAGSLGVHRYKQEATAAANKKFSPLLHQHQAKGHQNIERPKKSKPLLCAMDILIEVSQISKISVEVLQMKWRKREICEIRQFYFKRAKEKTNDSLATIGAQVGRDHATVLHGIKTVNNTLLKKYEIFFGIREPETKNNIEQAQKVISAGKTTASIVKKMKEAPIAAEPEVKPETKIVKMVSPYAEVAACNNLGYHGYREHSL